MVLLLFCYNQKASSSVDPPPSTHIQQALREKTHPAGGTNLSTKGSESKVPAHHAPTQL